jgi:hypothetical protein
MKVQYFGKYNSEGTYEGFYTSDTWKLEDIPQGCIELSYDEWQEALTGFSKVVDGKHIYTPITQEQIDADKLNAVRKKRNKLLQESDWTQMVTDIPMSDAKKEEWKAYRQALRDLPETVDINNVVYPQKPE